MIPPYPENLMKSIGHSEVVTKPKDTSYFRKEMFLRIINTSRSFGNQDQKLYRKWTERRRNGLGWVQTLVILL